MEIYIDRVFMDRFAEQTAHPLHDELRIFLKKPQTGQKILNFESVEAFEKAALENPLLEMLLESSVPILNPDFQEQMKEGTFYDSGNTKLFFNEAENNEQLEADFGCIFINSQQLHKTHFLFNWHLIPFTNPHPRYDSWGFMKQFRHPCNALIVTDNYLFAKKYLNQNKQQLDENLLVLLRELMPPSLKIPFHLTLIGSSISNYPGRENEEKIAYIRNNLEALHNHILIWLERYFSYPIHLNILITPFHDRNILTNYAWINSGNSFTYFENRRLHSNTNLSFKPITHLNNTYNPFYHTTEQIEKNTSVSEVWENIRCSCKTQATKMPDETTPFKFRSSHHSNRLLN